MEPVSPARQQVIISRAAVLISSSFVLLFLALAPPSRVSADGNGSPAECLGSSPQVNGSINVGQNGGTYNLPAGQVATGVCIKSGNNTFEGVTHSGPLDNGSYNSDGHPVDAGAANVCYTVAGVGTGSVTVGRLNPSSTCQGISHIDVVFESAPATPTPTATATMVPNGNLTIEKQCAEGVDPIPGRFIFNLNGTELGTVDCDQSRTFEVATGTYAINETGNNPLVVSLFQGPDCDEAGVIEVVAGETRTCVVFNACAGTPTVTATPSTATPSPTVIATGTPTATATATGTTAATPTTAPATGTATPTTTAVATVTPTATATGEPSSEVLGTTCPGTDVILPATGSGGLDDSTAVSVWLLLLGLLVGAAGAWLWAQRED